MSVCHHASALVVSSFDNAYRKGRGGERGMRERGRQLPFGWTQVGKSQKQGGQKTRWSVLKKWGKELNMHLITGNYGKGVPLSHWPNARKDSKVL